MMTSEDYKQYCEAVKRRFDGRCPYTDLKCDTFNCAFCEVEKQEFQWMKEMEDERDDRT